MPHWKSRIYYAWSSMKTRCTNPKRWNFSNYGARGIAVCERWNDYKNFHEDMAFSYFDGASLERIDNNKGYEPENCKWATNEDQANNKRNNRLIEFNGKRQTLPRWARELGIKSSTLRQRFYVCKWSIERCLGG